MAKPSEAEKIPGTPSSQTFPEAADLILHYLERIGVEYVFGVPGGAIEPLYNALARSARRGTVRPVVARHEAGATFMADGYARETGRLGVCCTTTGPGATNAITGVASAYQDDIPLLVITAQTPLDSFGRGAVQESSCTAVNTVAMMGHCTRYNSLVSHIDQLEHKLAAAITAAVHERGPAHLSIPLDILRAPIERSASLPRLDSLLHEPRMADPAALAVLGERLRGARHLVVVVGEGCRDAMGPITTFAEHYGAVLLTTPQGKGLVDPYHPHYRGVCGLAGHADARARLLDPSVDLVLAAGTALDEQAGQGWLDTVLRAGRLVQIDRLNRRFGRAPQAALHVGGDIATVFEGLLDGQAGAAAQPARPPWDTLKPVSPQGDDKVVGFLDRRRRERRTAPSATDGGVDNERRRGEWRRGDGTPTLRRGFRLADEAKYVSDAVPIKPQRLMHELSRLFPPGTRFLADIGNSFLWGIHYLHPHHPAPLPDGNGRLSGYFRTSMGFASMGWAIGGAVGTALGDPARPVVSIVGDGSMLMNGQEITTALMHGLNIVFVILNDGALGTVRHGQRLAGAEPVAYELPPIDFAAFARAMGVEARRIETPRDLLDLDSAALLRRGAPTVLDVLIDGEEIPPLYERMEILGR